MSEDKKNNRKEKLSDHENFFVIQILISASLLINIYHNAKNCCINLKKNPVNMNFSRYILMIGSRYNNTFKEFPTFCL